MQYLFKDCINRIYSSYMFNYSVFSESIHCLLYDESLRFAIALASIATLFFVRLICLGSAIVSQEEKKRAEREG